MYTIILYIYTIPVVRAHRRRNSAVGIVPNHPFETALRAQPDILPVRRPHVATTRIEVTADDEILARIKAEHS